MRDFDGNDLNTRCVRNGITSGRVLVYVNLVHCLHDGRRLSTHSIPRFGGTCHCIVEYPVQKFFALTRMRAFTGKNLQYFRYPTIDYAQTSALRKVRFFITPKELSSFFEFSPDFVTKHLSANNEEPNGADYKKFLHDLQYAVLMRVVSRRVHFSGLQHFLLC
jgi:hypothetical protein